jgi:hypothetical protein
MLRRTTNQDNSRASYTKGCSHLGSVSALLVPLRDDYLLPCSTETFVTVGS